MHFGSGVGTPRPPAASKVHKGGSICVCFRYMHSETSIKHPRAVPRPLWAAGLSPTPVCLPWRPDQGPP